MSNVKSDLTKKDDSIKTLEAEIATKNNDVNEKTKTIAQVQATIYLISNLDDILSDSFKSMFTFQVRKLARRYKAQFEELKKEVDEKQNKSDEVNQVSINYDIAFILPSRLDMLH